MSTDSESGCVTEEVVKKEDGAKMDTPERDGAANHQGEDARATPRPKKPAAMNGLEERTLILLRLCVGESVEVVCQDKSLPGTPDFTIPKLKAAIFADGIFFHGNGRGQRMRRVAIKFLAVDDDRAKFWSDKILTNVARDRRVNKELRALGYKVVRLKEERLNGNDPLGYVSKALHYALLPTINAIKPKVKSE